MKHICYKSRKQLISIYGEELGDVLHTVLINRRINNKMLGIEEKWWTFIIYPLSGQLLLASYCK